MLYQWNKNKNQLIYNVDELIFIILCVQNEQNIVIINMIMLKKNKNNINITVKRIYYYYLLEFKLHYCMKKHNFCKLILFSP